jgi:hypothetical protein
LAATDDAADGGDSGDEEQAALVAPNNWRSRGGAANQRRVTQPMAVDSADTAGVIDAAEVAIHGMVVESFSCAPPFFRYGES